MLLSLNKLLSLHVRNVQYNSLIRKMKMCSLRSTNNSEVFTYLQEEVILAFQNFAFSKMKVRQKGATFGWKPLPSGPGSFHSRTGQEPLLLNHLCIVSLTKYAQSRPMRVTRVTSVNSSCSTHPEPMTSCQSMRSTRKKSELLRKSNSLGL